jgi:CTP synthase (UTP-ammonia lyase)
MEQQIALDLKPRTKLQELYGTSRSIEHTTCNYGLAPGLQQLADLHGMRVSATDATGEVRAIERVDHPFFVGTLFQPQLRSTPDAPHPVFTGLFDAAVRHQAAMPRR